MKKNSFSYSEGSYLSLKATMHKWGDPNWTRFLTRIFYNSMFGAGTNPTGFISESALQNKLNKEKTCQDHYLSPQFMGRMILDNQDKYLSDYETFEKVFWYSCRTIIVTQKENENLSSLTSNRDEKYQVLVPTNMKYNHLNIFLYKRDQGKIHWKYAKQIESNILEVPEELLQYEKQYLTT